MDNHTKELILKLKEKSDNMRKLSFELMSLAREVSNELDTEARKHE